VHYHESSLQDLALLRSDVALSANVASSTDFDSSQGDVVSVSFLRRYSVYEGPLTTGVMGS
jgi:hypothetical protein